MDFSKFSFEADGKKEQYKDAKSGVRRDMVDTKFQKIFDVFDTNKNGTLETNELGVIFDNLSKFAKEDKVLNISENEQLAKSVFIGSLQPQEADFMGFVKSVTDESTKIVSSEEKTNSFGQKTVTTKYSDGSTEVITYNALGNFESKNLTKNIKETFWEVTQDGQTVRVSDAEAKALHQAILTQEQEDKNKAKINEGKVPTVATSTPTLSQRTETKRVTNTIVSADRFAVNLGLDPNTNGEKIVNRFEQLSDEAKALIGDGNEVREILEEQGLEANFENITTVLEFCFGVTLQTEEELSASQGKREELAQQVQSAQLLSNLFEMFGQWYDQKTDNEGLFELASEGLGYLASKIGIPIANNYQIADACHEIAQDILKNSLNPEKFAADFKRRFNKDYNPSDFTELMNLAQSGKLTDKNNNLTPEFKGALQKATGLEVNNPNNNTAQNIVAGVGEIALMLMTFGATTELNVAKAAGGGILKLFSKAGIKVAGMQAKNRFLQGAARIAGRSIKLLGPMTKEGIKMGTYSIAEGTLANATNSAVKADNVEDFSDRFVQREKQVLEGSKGAFAVGAFHKLLEYKGKNDGEEFI